jgi:hypothetical protein
VDRDALSRRRLLRTVAVTAAAPFFAWPVMVRAQEAEGTIEVTVAPDEPTVPPEPTATSVPAEPTLPPPPEPTPPPATIAPTPTAMAERTSSPTPTSTPTTTPAAAAQSASARRGSVTATFERASLGVSGPLPYDAAERVIAGSVTVTVVDDRSGPARGWDVALAAGPFRHRGDYTGLDIPASALRIVSAGTPVALRGQSINASGPFAGSNSSGSSLDTPRLVMSAVPGGGRGAYRVTIAIELTVPPFARPGRYTGILLLTVNTGP